MKDITDDFDGRHRRRLNLYLKRMEKIFEDLIQSISVIAVKAQLSEELFQFKKHNNLQKYADDIFLKYIKDLTALIKIGNAEEWELANLKANAVKQATLDKIKNRLKPEAYTRELKKLAQQSHNQTALDAFQHRKAGKFTISERVWDIGKQAQENIELAIDLALKDGISAQQLARDIKKFLNNPEALYRKVRDKHGNLKLSKAAKAYKPGQGVYRSAHKNALRLAANEINTAYREAEQLRLEQNNDVVGVEIHLSPSHKIYDICDELKGRYRKDFKWSKWHVGCKCFRTSILKTNSELIKEINSGRNEPPEKSANYVGDLPPQFTNWVNENAEKMKNWKRKPEFIENNRKFLN